MKSELHKFSASLAKWCRKKNYRLIHGDLEGVRESVNRRIKRLNKFNGKIQEISTRSKELTSIADCISFGKTCFAILVL